MSRLTLKSIDEIKNDMFGVSKEFVYKHDSTVVLKDSRTVIYTNDRFYINTSGNNGMATAGSGDVLSGILGALLTANMNGFYTACAGVYIHGRAGDIAAKTAGRHSMVATDIVAALGQVLD